MANLPVRPDTQPNQEFQDLLQQGKMRLAGKLATGPTDAEKFGDFGSLFSAGFQGGNEFRQEKQRQTGNQFAQDEQLRGLLAHQDNLSVQQAEQQRLQLAQIHKDELDKNNFGAKIIEQMAQGNEKDRNTILQKFIGHLVEQDIDDDDLTYPQITQILSDIGQELQASGQLEGPAPEPMAPGQPLMQDGEFTGEHTPFAPVDEAKRAADAKAAEDKLRLEYSLKTDLEQSKGGSKPYNVVLPDGKTVTTVNGATYVDENGVTQHIPTVGTVFPSKDTAYDTMLAARQKGGIAATLRKFGIDPDSGIVGVGQIQGKFSHETRNMFNALTKSPGIGPWAMLAAGLDAVGGLGLGEALGYKTSSLFPDTVINRNHLKLARQFGKSAFILSDKYPTYEQKIVEDFFPSPDDFFENPDTQVYVLADIHDRMLERKVFHLQSAYDAVDQKTIDHHVRMVTNIGAFIRMIGSPDPDTIRKFGLGPGLGEPNLEVIRTSNIEEWNAFIKNPDYPSGTPVISPDGLERRKP